MKVRIFTDGSCSGNPGRGGWGAIVLLPESRKELKGTEDSTTNNRMELKAVIEALKEVLYLGYKKIDIYSDSAYVVNAVKQKWIKKWEFNGFITLAGKEVKNKDLWLELIMLLEQSRDINLIKVKGHSGIKHNEQVDKLAKSYLK